MRNSTIKQRSLSFIIILSICLFIPSDIRAQFGGRKNLPLENQPFEIQPVGNSAPFQAGQERQEPKYAPGEVLVKFKEGAEPEAVLQEIDLEAKNIERVHSIKPALSKFRKSWKLEKDSNGWYWFMGKKYQDKEEVSDEEVFQEAYKEMSPEEKTLYRSYKIALPEETSVEQAVVELENNPDVEYAQPNYIMEVHMIPNDPYYHTTGTWGQSYDDLWGLKRDKLNCQWAWNISQGEGVTVAVIDTGVDYNHEDLTGNIWINQAELHGLAGFDDDGNGYVDDVRGWDFSGDFNYPPDPIQPDNDPSDYYGHGSHCAGIVAAVGNNNKGIIGVAPRAKIMPLKIFPNAYTDVAVQAIKYAADNGARVLSNSWGPPFRRASDPSLEDAVDYAYSRNCVLVFSAGNNNDDVAYYSPANYTKTIAVAATDRNDVKTDFSNWGNKIDIAAPGGDSGNMLETPSGEHFYVNILSLRAEDTDMYEDVPNYTPGEFVLGNHYYRARGTSMSGPYVAGVAALIISQEPSRTPIDVKRVLFASADDKGPEGFDRYHGFGRVNAFRALIANSISYVRARMREPEPDRQFSNVVTITGTAIAKNFSHYTIDVGEGKEPESWSDFGVSLNSGGGTEVVDDMLGAWNSSHSSYGIYTIRLRVFNTSGLSREHRVTIVINNLIQEGWPQHVEGRSSSNPVIVDIDNDGDPEIIAGSYADAAGEVYVWHHDGTIARGWPVSLGGVCRTPAAGDLDGDGYMEIVVEVEYPYFERHYEKIFVFQYDGTPYPGDWPKGDGREIEYVTTIPTIADVDKDGFLEIIVGGENGELHAWHHDGTIVSGWPVNVEYSRSITAPAVGDIDGDGRTEIVAAVGCKISDDWTGYIYAWNDDGTLVPGNWPVTVDGAVEPPVLGDIDGDNQLEILVNALGTLFAFEHDGTIIPGWPKEMQLEEINWGSPMLGDLDRDGMPEIIVTGGSFSYDSSDNMISKNGVWVFRGDGTTFGNWPHEFDFHNSGFAGASLVANIDADDDVEVVVLTNECGDSDWRTHLYIFDNNGSLKTGYPKRFDMEPYFIPALDDLDGDGDIEVAAFGKYNRNCLTPFYAYDLEGYCEDRRMEWPMFQHDPQHTGLYAPPEGENNPPAASITSISPNPAYQGDTVSFEGSATDPDEGDTIVAYKWASSIDGLLSEEASFATNALSAGTHTITFEAQDSGNTWSMAAIATLEIKPSICELSLKDGDIVSSDVYVSMAFRGEMVPWFQFKVDGCYAQYNPWRTQYFSNGEHTVYGQYASGGEWHKTPPITVVVNNVISYVPEITFPADGAEVSGNVNVSFETKATSAYFAFLYANNKIVGWKILYQKQPPHNILWRTAKLPNGPCDLKLVVYYFLAGAVTSESARVTINNSTIPAPIINLTCPNPASGIVNVHISSDDNIDFFAPTIYANGKLIGFKWWLPCDIIWDTKNFPNGSYNLHFRAYYRSMRKWIELDRVVEIRN